jgi:hypothetical protein
MRTIMFFYQLSRKHHCSEKKSMSPEVPVAPMTYRKFMINITATSYGYIIRDNAGHFICTAPTIEAAQRLIDRWWEHP